MAVAAVKNINNPIKDDIFYHIKNGEISFFYRDFLLFKHSKNNPVISIIIYKGETEKEVPLANYDIRKIQINDYEIDFYVSVYKVCACLKLENNFLNIKIKNQAGYPAIKISVRNSAGRIRGLGFNKEEAHSGKEFYSDGFYGDIKKRHSDDKVLSFTKDKKYFFTAEGSFEWKIRFGTLIDIYFKNTYYLSLKVFFDKIFEENNLYSAGIFQKNRTVISCNAENADSLINTYRKYGKEISAVILNDNYINFWDLMKYSEKLRGCKIKVIRKIQPKISIYDDYFNEFGKDDFIQNEKGNILIEKNSSGFVYFDLSNPETCRKVKNYIRRVLGTNIDGFYSVEKENLIYNFESYQKLSRGINEIWQMLIYEASKEYFNEKILIFDTLSTTTFNKGYYLIEGKRLFSLKYKKYIENLKSSGVNNLVIGFGLFDGAIIKNFNKKLERGFNIIYK